MSEATSEREPGFYWVQGYLTKSDWIVAQWTGHVWFVPGHQDDWRDMDFTAIGRRIPEPAGGE